MSKFRYGGKDKAFGRRMGFGRPGGIGDAGKGPTNANGVIEPQNYGSYGAIPPNRDPAAQPLSDSGSATPGADAAAAAELRNRAQSSMFKDGLQ